MKINKSNKVNKTFRNQTIISQFDLQIEDKIEEAFEFDFNLPEDWKLGVIVGNSGTGKTTIAKELFNLENIENNYDSNLSVLDLFNKKTTLEEISKTIKLKCLKVE
jgi:ABC-type glutathione transport system ATPase component